MACFIMGNRFKARLTAMSKKECLFEKKIKEKCYTIDNALGGNQIRKCRQRCFVNCEPKRILESHTYISSVGKIA